MHNTSVQCEHGQQPDACVCPVRYQALRQPDAIAIKHGRICVNYQQLDDLVSVLVEALQRAGVSEGYRLVCLVSDVSILVPLIFAALRSGVIIIPVNPKYPADYAKSLFSHIKPRFVVNETTLKQLLASVATRENYNDSCNVPIDQLAPFTGIFTSGSSGHPKLAMHCYKNHYSSAMGSQQQIPLKSGDCWALTLPLHHVSGLAIVMRVIIAGATIAIRDGEALADFLAAQYVTHLSAVPSQLEQLRLHPAPMQDVSLRYLLVGGAACSEALLRWLQAKDWQVLISYGMTETASQAMTGPANSQGILRQCLPGQQIKIANTGEILVRGDTLFLGYWHEGHIELPVDAEGWFHTRDIGQLTDDGLTYMGRIDSQFISGGENIQPEEIERFIYALLSVEQCIVVPRPDAIYGSIPVCFLSRLPDAKGLEQLQRQLSAQLPAFKVPREFFPLEVSDGGQLKVSRQSLVQRLLSKP